MLHQRQAQAIASINQAHKEAVSPLNSSLGPMSNRILKRAHAFWHKKFTDERDSFASFVQEITLRHTRELEKLSDEMAVAESVIASISSELQSGVSAVQAAFSQAQNGMADAAARQRGEIPELNGRHSVMEQSLEAAEADFRSGESQRNGETSTDGLAKLQQTVGDLKDLLKKQRTFVMQILSERRQATADARGHDKDLSDSYAAELSQLRAEYGRFDRDLSREVDNMVVGDRKVRESRAMTLEALRRERQSLISGKGGEISRTLSESHEELQERLSSEQAAMRARFRESEQAALAAIHALDDRLSDAAARHLDGSSSGRVEAELAELQRTLDGERESHARECRAGLDSARCVLEQQQKRTEEIQCLEKERDLLVRSHATELRKIAQDEPGEQTLLKDRFLKEKRATQEAEHESLTALLRLQRAAVSEMHLRCARECSAWPQKCQEMTEAHLSTVRTSILAQPEAWVVPFNERWAAAKRELFQAEREADDTDLSDAIDELKAAKRKAQSSITAEREQIGINWERECGEENARHAIAATRPRSPLVRNQMFRSLESAIQALREEEASQSGVLQESLAELNAQHQNDMDRLAKLKCEAEKAGDDSDLRRELKAAQENFEAVATVEARVNDELRQARLSFEAEVDEQETMQAHAAQVAQLMRDIAEECKLLADLDQHYVREKHRQIARNEYEILDQQKRFLQAKNDDIARLVAISAFYNERLSVLRARVNALKGKWDSRPARQSDLDLIEKLTQDLRAVKAQERSTANEQDKAQAKVAKREPRVSPRSNERARVRMRSSRSRT
jgi:hypothetical protein